MSDTKTVGSRILKDIMDLSDIEIREFIKDKAGEDSRWNELLTKKGYITRTIYREQPFKIVLEFYDRIEIDKDGIRWIEECGRAKAVLVDFEKEYKRCSCGNGKRWVEGEAFGTFAPESFEVECSKCDGTSYVKND